MTAMERIRSLSRSFVTVIELGFGAAPVRVSVAMTADLLSAGFTLAASYMIKFIVQEAVARHASGAVWAAAALALTAGGAVVAGMVYNTQLPKIIELVLLRIDRELIQLTNGISTIEYHDRPAFADKLALVRQNRRSFSAAVQTVGLIVRAALMSAGVIAIMASIDPRFLLLPLFAVPRIFAGVRAQALTKQAQDAYAQPMRLRAHLYGKIASAAAGKEIRVFGLEQTLTNRWWSLTRTIRHERARSDWGGAGWLMLGDCVFMAAYVAAIGWVVIRAAKGEIGVGDVVLTATMAATLLGVVNLVALLGQSVPLFLLTIERFHWLEDFARAEPATATPTMPPPVL
jgi:ATP-binding cassette subfamily B protein